MTSHMSLFAECQVWMGPDSTQSRQSIQERTAAQPVQ